MTCVVCDYWQSPHKWKDEPGEGECWADPTPVKTLWGYSCSRCRVDPKNATRWFENQKYSRVWNDRIVDDNERLKRKLEWNCKRVAELKSKLEGLQKP